MILDRPAGEEKIECVTGVWGWSGWVSIVLVPFALWAPVVALLVLVFRRGPSVAAYEEEPVVEVQPVREPQRERSALGWFPPVAPHHH